MKVLWVSRHEPLESQVQELKRKLGDVEIVKFSKNIASAEEVVEFARQIGAKYIVPVLPLSMIARLAEHREFTVLFARMQAVAATKSIEEAQKIVAENPSRRSMTTYADGTVRVFEFVQFEKLIRVELVTEPF
jgi:hypothetical protein